MIKRVVLVAALSLGMAACAHKMKPVEMDKNSNPSAEIEVQGRELQEARNHHVDVLSPDNYKDAEKHWEKAKTALQKDKDNEKILEEVGYSKAYLSEANTVAARSQSSLQDVMTAREAAMKARADQMYEKDFAKADDDFKGLSKDLENDKDAPSANKVEKLQGKYFDLQVKAMQKDRLGGVYSALEDAEKNRAKHYAPETYEQTKIKLGTAEKMIENNRSEPAAADQAVNDARISADKLAFVLAHAKESGGKDSEKLALALYDQQQAGKSLQSRLSDEERAKAGLNSQLSDTRLQLRDTRSGLTAAQQRAQAVERENKGLESQVDFQRKIDEVRTRFSADEADVYQQGQNVVLRLKKVQFPTNKAELPTAASPTMDKVKAVIADLGANKVIVEGHTDSIGTEDVNKKLSEARAETVKQALAKDVNGGMIESVGYGDTKPLTTNKTKEGRAQNRRVDIIITPSSATNAETQVE